MSVKAEEWIELHPIRTMDDTFKTFAKDDGRKFVLEPMFEKLKLAAISGLASGTASGGGSDIDDPFGLVANVQNESCEKAVGNVPSTTAQSLSTQRERILLMRHPYNAESTTQTRGKASTNFAFQGWDGDYCRGNSTTIITRRGYRNEGLRAAQ